MFFCSPPPFHPPQSPRAGRNMSDHRPLSASTRGALSSLGARGEGVTSSSSAPAPLLARLGAAMRLFAERETCDNGALVWAAAYAGCDAVDDEVEAWRALLRRLDRASPHARRARANAGAALLDRGGASSEAARRVAGLLGRAAADVAAGASGGGGNEQRRGRVSDSSLAAPNARCARFTPGHLGCPVVQARPGAVG